MLATGSLVVGRLGCYHPQAVALTARRSYSRDFVTRPGAADSECPPKAAAGRTRLLARQGIEHADELAGQGYDGLLLFEWVALPGGVVFVRGGKFGIGSCQRARPRGKAPS